MYTINSKATDIESQVADNETRQALLTVLKKRLAQLHQAGPEDDGRFAGLIKEKIVKLSESGESDVAHQQPHGESDSLAPESDSLPGESDSLSAESVSPPTESEAPATAKKFAAELEKLDPGLRQIASDLYEQLHHKTIFARLTADERDAILELLKYHPGEEVAKIVAQPPPIGFNLQTSKAGINRFREDYMRCAMRRSKIESHRQAEQARIAAEESFKKANASEDTFRQTTERQIRKRLFDATHDPDSDYHEIRWLIKSLEMLNQNVYKA